MTWNFYVVIYWFKWIFIFHLKHETVDGYRRYFTQIVGYVSNMEETIYYLYSSLLKVRNNYFLLALSPFPLNPCCVGNCHFRFFVVEDHILHVTQGLVTRVYTEELWNMALSKIIAVLRAHSVSQTSYGHHYNFIWFV